MINKVFAKRALLPSGWESNVLITVENGTITDVSVNASPEGAKQIAYITGGLLDVHIHGGFEFDCMHNESVEGYEKWLTKLAQHGVGGVLAGVHTNPVDSMNEGVRVAAEAMRLQKEGKMGGAKLVGIHLEGPFISHTTPGAMDIASIIPPTIENYEKIVGEHGDCVRLITMAPEEEGAHVLAAELNRRGVRVQAGHTAATDVQAREAFAAGFRGVCHTFNASPAIRHRAPGLIAESMTRDDIYNECICDLVHVQGTVVKLLYRCKGPKRFIAITDAVSTAGRPDGVYEENGNQFYIENGAGHLMNGTLNGSGITLDRGVRNLVSLGISPEDALCSASKTPAEWLGVPFGMIVKGNEAALSCFDENLEPVCTIVNGREYACEG